MHSPSDKRTLPRRKAFSAQRPLTIQFGKKSGSGLSGKLIDASSGGLRLETTWPMEVGATVSVAGEIDSPLGRQKMHGPCLVRWCTEIDGGKFIAGLSFVAAGAASGEADSVDEADMVDHYEVLQVSRGADTETIHRVFHLMASRYHPDNLETGNSDLFRKVVEAHDVLCDPECRAALDAALEKKSKGRARLFKSYEETQGVEAEIRKRQGILRLLYMRRLTEPHAPSLGARDFEELLAVPREHLEFSFWLLKENKYIARSDNNRFEITVQGVLAFEAEERLTLRHASAVPFQNGLLPEPALSQV